jgi:hypothetical protein
MWAREMSEDPIARWRLIGFDVVFVTLPLALVAGLAALAIGAPGWSLAAGVGAGTVGAHVGLRLIRLPEESRVPSWAGTVGIGIACVSGLFLGHVSNRISIVPGAFLTVMVVVISVSLLVRRRRHPESFGIARR